MRAANVSKIKTACAEDLEEPVLIYRYRSKDKSAIIQHFDNYCYLNSYDSRKVVVRGNTVRNKMLGRNALQQPWNERLPYDLITAKIEYEDNNLKEAIKLMRNLTVEIENPEADHSKKVQIKEELTHDFNNNARLINLIKNLPSLNNTVAEWSILCPSYFKSQLNADVNVFFKLKKASKYFDKSTRDESVSDHFNRVDISKSNALTTVHQVKGKTLDAILIFFDEKNHKENINFRDIEADENGFISEKRELFTLQCHEPNIYYQWLFLKV